MGREATVICNQAASFNRCLFKVQQGMQAQLKTLHSESKGKSSTKVSAATDELQYLMDFNASITQAAAKIMEHLTDFVFISIGILTLACRDAYLNHLKTGIKPDTRSALRTAQLHILTLFPDSVIKRAEEEIAHYENKGQTSSSRGKGQRIIFKTLVLVYKYLTTGQPKYFAYLPLYKSALNTRRSNPKNLFLLVPSYCPSIHKSKVHFNNSFSYDAPKLWNDLPYDIRSAPNLSSFKSRLNTYLFQKSFPP